MTQLVLYAAPGACARVPMIALEEARQDFEVRVVRFMAGEHRSPEYLALNAKGKVPLLLVDGEPSSENVAILLHLADRFPEARLLPKAATERDQLRVIEDPCSHAATLHPVVTRIRLPNFFADGRRRRRASTRKRSKRCAQHRARRGEAQGPTLVV